MTDIAARAVAAYPMCRTLLLGLATYVPGLHAALRRGTGGTNSARYCYSVWLRHLVLANAAGLPGVPRRVAELGPGDSLGIGLCALLSGAEAYCAMDAVAHADRQSNLAIFDQLVELFSRREPIPGREEFPGVKPAVSDYAFPSHILDDATLERALEPDRIRRLRRALEDAESSDGLIAYVAPWTDATVQQSEAFDLVFSQAVLEHVDEIEQAYRTMRRISAPGGYLTHQVDFKCHGTSSVWNGHMGYSPSVWRLMRGRLPYLLNRKVASDHRRYIADAGLRLIEEVPVYSDGGLKLDQVAREMSHVTDDDLRTSSSFFVIRNPTAAA